VIKGHATAAPADATEFSLEDIEIQLLLEGIRLTYGYDFREYAMRPLRRNIIAAIQAEGIPTISAYQDRILHDATCMQRFIGMVGVSVTSMFREVELTHALRDEVIPVLRTYPSVRIWMVGCATGEEVYSLAILLEEEGVLRHARIYATDLNEDTLAVARMGAYPLDRMRSYEEAYRRAGGRLALSDYYTVSGRSARFYFRPTLQERAHRLFYDSLVRSGYLALGKGESLVFSPGSSRYQQVRNGVSLFRKVR